MAALLQIQSKPTRLGGGTMQSIFAHGTQHMIKVTLKWNSEGCIILIATWEYPGPIEY